MTAFAFLSTPSARRATVLGRDGFQPVLISIHALREEGPGQMIEEAPVKELFAAPAHPYTKALLQTVPGIYDEKDRELVAIPGMVPENYDSIPGCRFADRCAFRTKGCDQPQSYRQIGEGHFVRCMLAKEGET